MEKTTGPTVVAKLPLLRIMGFAIVGALIMVAITLLGVMAAQLHATI